MAKCLLMISNHSFNALLFRCLDIYGIRTRALGEGWRKTSPFSQHCKAYGDKTEVWMDENIRET